MLYAVADYPWQAWHTFTRASRIGTQKIRTLKKCNSVNFTRQISLAASLKLHFAATQFQFNFFNRWSGKR